tara:strand:+ start:453 stop:1124 length:672 start_codon:yes stop_codon:yes gene_type:complete
MGIKTFFRNLGRGIKHGFNTFVSKAGTFLGGAGTFLQQKAIPAIASGANQVAGAIGKASPLLDMAGAEASATAGEVADVAKQVGAGVGKFADFIGSNAPKGRVATPAEQAEFAKTPLGMAFRRSQTKAPPASMPTAPTAPLVPPSAPKPSLAVMPPMPKGLISPAPMANPNPLKVAGMAMKPLGSDPATYTPKMSSGIEAPPSASQPNIIKANGVSGAPMLSM